MFPDFSLYPIASNICEKGRGNAGKGNDRDPLVFMALKSAQEVLARVQYTAFSPLLLFPTMRVKRMMYILLSKGRRREKTE